jgi:superfamily II DNA or RNA helicase
MIRLRDYQAQGKNDIFNAWIENDILMFVLATGGGKTVTFVEVIKELLFAGKKIMLIAHREELILQAWNTLGKANIYAGIIMSGYPENFTLPVQVCSIQTIARRKNLVKLFPADALIIDEGHHAQSDNTYGGIVATYSSAKVLAVTATPYRLSGNGFRYIHSYKETKLIINRTFKQLQDEAWLCPFRYYAASIPDLSEVHLQKGDYVEEEARKAMELAPLVESYMEHSPGLQGVCFAVNIEHSKQIVDQYNRYGITARHIDGSTPKEERQQIFRDYRAGLIKIIVNVGIITEGADFPDCAFVQLACPTKSLSKYLQCVGRGSRALTGVLDGLETIEERRAAIAASGKPYFVVLDNAGCWIDHNLPDFEHDWNRYFIGTKRQKRDELGTMEMLVYVAEDSLGNRIRSTKPEEIEGLKLVEICVEERRKLISVTSIKELDRLYFMFCKKPYVKKPGYLAMNEFIKHCNSQQILITDEVWLYMKKLLIDTIEDKIAIIESNRNKHPEAYPMELFLKSIEEIKAKGIANSAWQTARTKYEKENLKQILENRFGVRVPASGQLRL